MTWPRGTEASGRRAFRAAITLCVLASDSVAAKLPNQITGACSFAATEHSRAFEKKALKIIAPVAGILSSPFAPRFHPIFKILLPHHGWDIAAPLGVPVVAALDGTVEFAGKNGSYGNFIRISHTDAITTAYAHLDSFDPDIKKGVHVQAGEVIGYLGNSGLSTAPHLHFETRIGSRKVNPAGFFCSPASLPSPRVTTLTTLKHKGKNNKPKEAL